MNFEGSPIENNTSNESIKQKELFMHSFNTRINELVEQGRIPEAYAESRSRAAESIEDGLTDPEKMGIMFAEIGIEEIESFQNKVREIESYTGEKIISPFEDRSQLESEDKKFDQLEEDVIAAINILRKLTAKN